MNSLAFYENQKDKKENNFKTCKSNIIIFCERHTNRECTLYTWKFEIAHLFIIHKTQPTKVTIK